MLKRANIIVRKYFVGQYISFHVDEQQCDEDVLGLILRNDHPQHHGLIFRQIEKNTQKCYTTPEYPGTIYYPYITQSCLPKTIYV